MRDNDGFRIGMLLARWFSDDKRRSCDVLLSAGRGAEMGFE